MDARTRFKSAFPRSQAPVPAPAADDEDWDAVIARAKEQGPSPAAPSPRWLPPRRETPTAPYAALSSLSRQAQTARRVPLSRRSSPSRSIPPELQETPPPPSIVPPELHVTPPPPLMASPGAPRPLSPERTRATLNALALGARSRRA